MATRRSVSSNESHKTSKTMLHSHVKQSDDNMINEDQVATLSPLEIHGESSSTFDQTNSTIDEQYYTEREAAKIRHWKESEYAVGLVEPSWGDELESYRVKKILRQNARNHTSGSGTGFVAALRENAREMGEDCADSCSSMCQEEIDPGCGCVYMSAVVCSRLGAGRIGNMAVLKEKYILVEDEDNDTEESCDGSSDNVDGLATSGNEQDEDNFHDEEEALHQRNTHQLGKNTELGNRKTAKSSKRLVRRREIQLIVGPFWPMLLCVTYPLIFGVSLFTLHSGLNGRPLYIKIIWGLLTGQLIRSLFNTGFRDPGILKRYETPPPTNENLDDSDRNGRPKRRIGSRWNRDEGAWRWSDQAQSYRPRNSMYDPDCKVVVEEFDHTCPWTGTAIGKKNMSSFQTFVGLVFVCLILDIFLLTDAIPR